jgi:hypothetical protein
MSSLSAPDDERYGQFPSVLSVKTPLGMRGQLRAAAAVEKISVGEFVRRALGEAIGGRSTRREGISSERRCGP